MLDTSLIGGELGKLGFDFYTGVPCSYLKDLINYAINEVEYYATANEGDAVAIGAGAYLGGRKAVVLMQNSGLTNATSPLTSLTHIFQIPVLGFVSLRGQEGVPDEPQHELMGKITTDLLTLMKIEWDFLSSDRAEAIEQLIRANSAIENEKTFFFVVRKGTFGSVELNSRKVPPMKTRHHVRADETIHPAMPTRREALRSIAKIRNDDTIFFATTGYTGRELYELGDVPNNLYMVGSMGCASSLALGFALARKDKRVVAIDGDGALLMRMGALATNGYYSPTNLLHIVLDNNAHDSTGGQATVSHNVVFSAVANASGYLVSKHVHTLKELEEAIAEWCERPILTFIHLRIALGTSKDLGRPNVKPFQVARRLRSFYSIGDGMNSL